MCGYPCQNASGGVNMVREQWYPSHWRRAVAPVAVIALVALLCTGCASPLGMVAPVPVAARPLAQPHLARAQQPTYVAIGASDAFGIGTDDPKTQSWPVVLAGQLGTGIHLVNLGIPGATADLAVRDELPIAEDVQPAVITVWLGVNDFDQNVPLADFTRQLQSLLTTLKQTTVARLYVGNLPDLASLPRYAHTDAVTLREHVQAWNSAIATVCEQLGVAQVDIFSTNDLVRHPEYIAGDGFHPSTAGAQRLAAIFLNAILAGGPLTLEAAR